MSSEENVALFRRVLEEGFNNQNFQALQGIYTPDFQEHQYGMPPTIEGVVHAIQELHEAFPDFHIEIEEVIARGNKVWGRMTATGTHLGAFIGLPPTGKSFKIQVMDICRFEGGKMAEHWGVPDRFSLLRQLGLLPRPQARTPAPVA